MYKSVPNPSNNPLFLGADSEFMFGCQNADSADSCTIFHK